MPNSKYDYLEGFIPVNHYKTMRWAVSMHGVNSNSHIQSIKSKLKSLTEYDLDQDVVLSELWYRYMEREHYLKYNPNLSALSTFISAWVDLELNNIKRRMLAKRYGVAGDVLDRLNEQNCVNVFEMGLNNDRECFVPIAAIDYETPEGLVMLKEILTLARNYFSEGEWKYLIGEIDLVTLSKWEGTSPASVLRRLRRKSAGFKVMIEDE